MKLPGLFPQPMTWGLCIISLLVGIDRVISITMAQSHQHYLLHRAEIGHCSSSLNVLYDVFFFQQLVRTLPCDVSVSAATKELLGRRCQHQWGNVLGVIWVK